MQTQTHSNGERAKLSYRCRDAADFTDICACLISSKKMKDSLQSRCTLRFKICNLFCLWGEIEQNREVQSVWTVMRSWERWYISFVLSYRDENKHFEWMHQTNTRLGRTALWDAGFNLFMHNMGWYPPFWYIWNVTTYTNEEIYA